MLSTTIYVSYTVFRLCQFSVFSDDVTAIKSVWLLGENFLKEAFQSFRAMNTRKAHEEHTAPYLFQHYNVLPWHPPQWSQTLAFLAKVLNSLINGLNSETYLPRYLLIILDKDLVASTELYDFGISRALEDTIKWLLINVNNAIEIRKQALIKKHPGAVSTSSEPRLILCMSA